jgi:hypothetical protein
LIERGKFLPEVKDGIFLVRRRICERSLFIRCRESPVEFQHQKKVLEDNAGKIKELKAYLSVDERIVLKLQEEGKLFQKGKLRAQLPSLLAYR